MGRPISLIKAWTWFMLLPFAGSLAGQSLAAAFFDQPRQSLNQPWAYGWKQDLKSPFQRFEKPFDVIWWNARVTGWSQSGEGPQHGEHCCPYVGKNRSGKIILGTGARVEKDDVWIHPGPKGEYAVVQYVCASPGVLRVEARFYGGGDGATDVHVLKNNRELWSAAIGKMGQVRDYRNLGVTCYANDVLEFAVGFGADRVYYGDMTGLRVNIEGSPSRSHPPGSASSR